MKRRCGSAYLCLVFISALGMMSGCGTTGKVANESSASTTETTTTTSGSNVDPISVNAGVLAGPPANEPYINGVFTSVTICAPGSSTNCQTIPDILVDSGSTGLRIFASTLNSTLASGLTAQTASNGNGIAECYPFVDAEVWGTLETADLSIAGEHANSLPIQVIGSANVSSGAQACQNSFGQPVQDTVAEFGANGILGISPAVQDCGEGCARK